MARLIGIALLLVAGLAVPALAAPRLDAEAALARSEAAIGRTIGGYTLTDSEGEPLRLEDLRGKPVVVSLIYTSCSDVCPVTTQSVRTAVERARTALGAGAFNVLTVGFDARKDTPRRLAAFAREQNVDGDRDWRLASGDAGTIAALIADLGFSYAAIAGGFDHVAQTTILDAGGRVYRQVYGDAFPIQVFVEPLKELVYGTATRSLTVTGLADRIRFLCTVYDPASGRYRIDYSIAFGIVLGGLSLVLTGIVVFRTWLHGRRVRALRLRENHASR